MEPGGLYAGWSVLTNFSGHVCSVVPALGGDVVLNTQSDCRDRERRTTMTNPAVWSKSGGVHSTIPFREVREGVKVLVTAAEPCTINEHSLLDLGGKLHHFDSRLLLETNTVQTPHTGSDSCVCRSAINADFCRAVVPPNGREQGLRIEVKQTYGQYVSSETQCGGLMAELVGIVDYNDTSDDSPVFPSHFFAAHFSGYLSVATAGVYQFWLAADDASTLFLDEALVIDTGKCCGPKLKDAVLNLSRGEHPLVVEYFQWRPPAFMRLEWSGPDSGNTRQLVNESVLSRNPFQGCAKSSCVPSMQSASLLV